MLYQTGREREGGRERRREERREGERERGRKRERRKERRGKGREGEKDRERERRREGGREVAKKRGRDKGTEVQYMYEVHTCTSTYPYPPLAECVHSLVIGFSVPREEGLRRMEEIHQHTLLGQCQGVPLFSQVNHHILRQTRGKAYTCFG